MSSTFSVEIPSPTSVKMLGKSVLNLALICFAVCTCISVIILGFVLSHPSRNGENVMTIPEKFETISKLSNFTFPSHTNPDICLEEGCLNAAIRLLAFMDPSENPCDNFYKFACGRAAKSSWNLKEQIYFRDMSDDTKQEDQTNEFYELIKKFEHSQTTFMKLSFCEKVKEYSETFDDNWPLINPDGWNVKTFNWQDQVADQVRIGMAHESAIIWVNVAQDFRNSKRKAIVLAPPLLVYEVGFLSNPKKYSELVGNYTNLISNYGAMINSSLSRRQLIRKANEIVQFEIKLAGISSNGYLLDQTSLSKIENFRLDQLQSKLDGMSRTNKSSIQLKPFLERVFMNTDIQVEQEENITLTDPNYFWKLSLLLDETDDETVANYIMWRRFLVFIATTNEPKFLKFLSLVLRQNAPILLNVIKESYETRVSTAMSLLPAMLSGNIKKVKPDIEKAEEIVLKIKSVLKQLFHESWIGLEKNKLIEKLESCRTAIGVMEIGNETELETEFDPSLEEFEFGMEYLANLKRLMTFSIKLNLNAYREPIDLDVEAINPLQIMPYYKSQANSMEISSDFLHKFIYSRNLPAHQIYSGIGFTIGHELAHAFDTIGLSFDKDGNFRKWLGHEMRTEFDQRATLMRDQYNEMYVDLGNGTKRYVNGTRTLHENIADNTGVRLMTMAYDKYVEENGEEKRLPGLEHFSSNQLLHLGFANIMCSVSKIEAKLALNYDTHSPVEVRINGALKNLEEFGKEWNCPVDSHGMNLPEEKRVRVW